MITCSLAAGLSSPYAISMNSDRADVAVYQDQRHHRRLHSKMEVISRRAYGFRNFQNYRLRVRALCG
jgi:hypothetical protein